MDRVETQVRKRKRVVLAGCFHFPLHDERKWQEYLQLVRDEKPDVVGLLGDTTEGAALSKFGNADMIGLTAEFRAEDEAKRAIRDAAPNARLVETLGNHDLETRLSRASPDLQDAIRFSYHGIVTENEHWHRLPYVNGPECVYWIGQLGMKHGHRINRTSDMDECLSWGCDYCLMVGAHTHRPRFDETCEVKSGVFVNRSYANTGTCVDMSDKPSRYFARMDTSRWGFAPLVVDVNDKRKHFGSRQWDARQVHID